MQTVRAIITADQSTQYNEHQQQDEEEDVSAAISRESYQHTLINGFNTFVDVEVDDAAIQSTSFSEDQDLSGLPVRNQQRLNFCSQDDDDDEVREDFQVEFSSRIISPIETTRTLETEQIHVNWDAIQIDSSHSALDRTCQVESSTVTFAAGAAAAAETQQQHIPPSSSNFIIQNIFDFIFRSFSCTKKVTEM